MFSDNEPAVSMIGFLCTETASLTLHVQHINAGKDNKDMPYLTYLTTGQYQKANTSVDASLTEIGKWRAANSTEAHS